MTAYDLLKEPLCKEGMDGEVIHLKTDSCPYALCYQKPCWQPFMEEDNLLVLHSLINARHLSGGLSRGCVME